MNDDQLLRYSRQILLPSIDVSGQEALLRSTVLVVGAGGLGSSAIYYLAAAGVGKLIVFDHDEVDISNLQRQVLHSECQIGQPKVFSAKKSIELLNTDIEFNAIHKRVTSELLKNHIGSSNIVLDCSDNLETRLMVNSFCVENQIPLVTASAIRFEAQLSVFDFRRDVSPCYSCLYQKFQTVEENCSQNGVIGPLVGILGSFQALEAVKIITGIGDNYAGYLSLFDGLRSEWQRFKIIKNNECSTCSKL